MKKDGGEMGMGDIMDMLNDMPLLSVLAFQQAELTAPPEEMVADMLRKVHSL